MDPLLRVRRPPALGNDITVPDDHQAVNLDVRGRLQPVEKGRDPCRVDACASGELRSKSLLFMRSQRVVDQPGGAAVGFALPVSDPSDHVAEVQAVGRPAGRGVGLQSAASSSDQA